MNLRRAVICVLLLATSIASARAADLVVMTSGGFLSSLNALVPAYEKQSGDHVSIVNGPSMGATPEAIPARLERHEAADVLTMVGPSLQDLVQKGLVDRNSLVVLANSRIGMAVKAGAPVPSIRSLAQFKQALLAATSIGYSDSASGVYIGKEMYKKLGLEAQLAPKSRMIPRDPVGGFVADGQVEVGFQQISELKPIQGITIVGPIPSQVQLVTPYDAGIVAASQQKAAARRLIAFLASPKAAGTLRGLGLDPMH
jgi:molybdate transport system substrate-binding protein